MIKTLSKEEDIHLYIARFFNERDYFLQVSVPRADLYDMNNQESLEYVIQNLEQQSNAIFNGPHDKMKEEVSAL